MAGFTQSVVLSVVTFMATACSGQPMLTSPEQIVFPDSAVSYRNHVQPFLTLTCAFAACHGDVNPAGGVRLTTYFTLFSDRANLLVPGAPDESLIIQVLDRRIPHSLDVLRPVNSNHIAGMRRWITEGALNN
jgi:hypothetical protein